VVRRMFADIDADIYVLVDGDATYDAASAPRMIEMLLSDHLDWWWAFVSIRRKRLTGPAIAPAIDADRLPLVGFRSSLQGYAVRVPRVLAALRQILSGAVGWFRNRNRAKRSRTELALPVAEIETPYYARPEGSFSKLNTWRDGFRILGTILKLYRSGKAVAFFHAIGFFLMLVSIGLAIPVIVTYLEEGIVPRLPTAVLSMA